MASSTKVVAEDKKTLSPITGTAFFFVCMANLIFEDVP